MNYLKRFTNDADYQSFKGGDFITPNVSTVEENNKVYYNPLKKLMNVTVKGDDMLCIGAPDTNIIIEEGMTWNEWINSSYKTESDGGYFEFIEPNLMSYITPGGYAECGFYIDSLDTKIVEDSHVIYFGYNKRIFFNYKRVTDSSYIQCYAEQGMTWREWYDSKYSQDIIAEINGEGIVPLEKLKLYEIDADYANYPYLWRDFEKGFGDGYALCYDNSEYAVVNADKPIVEFGNYIEEYSINFTDI